METIVIFLIADVHTERDRLDAHIANIEKRIGRALGEHDTLVCLGDLFGKPARRAPSLADKIRFDRELVEYVDALPFRLLCVHGNHDDAKRVWKIGAEEGEVFGQHAMRVGKNIFYLDDGQVYDLPVDAADEDGECISVLILGGSFGHLYKVSGAPVMDKIAFRQRYQHLISRLVPLQVDYVLAHDAPTSRLGKLVRLVFGKTEATDVLDAIEDNLIFYSWYYGHHHLDCDTTEHHHCLYRREADLTVPSDEEKPFNFRYLAEEQRAGDERGDEGHVEAEANLIGSLVAVNTAMSPEDKMTSGGWMSPYVPRDAEIECLERRILDGDISESASADDGAGDGEGDGAGDGASEDGGDDAAFAEAPSESKHGE